MYFRGNKALYLFDGQHEAAGDLANLAASWKNKFKTETVQVWGKLRKF
jgi:hypothetical protein